jgi:hypothetical protein
MDQATCPGCGGDNQCAVARSGRSDVRCWCMELTLPPAAPRTGAAPDAGCYCPACAARLAAPTAPG